MTLATPYRVGSMCTGAAMLEAGLSTVLPLDVRWHSEIDPDAKEVLRRRFPTIPNYGDIREMDWANADEIDVLCSGFPCQPFSYAGRQEGEADARFLFDDVADALSRMVALPRLCVFENVPGLLTTDGGRSMARVLHRLAALGYVGRYGVLPASAVGAPHERNRVLIVATHREYADPPPVAWAAGPVSPDLRSRPLMPTPRTSDTNGPGAHGDGGLDLRTFVARHLMSVTPFRDLDFGPWAPAVDSWADRVGRAAPPPGVPNPKGYPRLSARFAEWLMGWPDGWVTDILPRRDAIHLIGNGAVPQWAGYAYQLLTS